MTEDQAVDCGGPSQRGCRWPRGRRGAADTVSAAWTPRQSPQRARAAADQALRRACPRRCRGSPLATNLSTASWSGSSPSSAARSRSPRPSPWAVTRRSMSSAMRHGRTAGHAASRASTRRSRPRRNARRGRLRRALSLRPRRTGRARAVARFEPTLKQSADARMDDPLQVRERLRVGEDDRGQGAAVEAPVTDEHLVAESRADLRQRGAAGLGRFARELVCVDDDAADVAQKAARLSTCRIRSGPSGRSAPARCRRCPTSRRAAGSSGRLLGKDEPGVLGLRERGVDVGKLAGHAAELDKVRLDVRCRQGRARAGSCAVRASSGPPRRPGGGAGRRPSTGPDGRASPGLGAGFVAAWPVTRPLAPRAGPMFSIRSSAPDTVQPSATAARHSPKPPANRATRRQGSGAAVLDDPQLGAHGIEQAPVMRHDDHRPRRAAQERLERLARRNVEMVRRLVEQQQIGRLQADQRKLEA